MPSAHAHSHCLRSPNAAVVEFILWLVWFALRPVVAGIESASPRVRGALFACAVALIAINLVWLAA